MTLWIYRVFSDQTYDAMISGSKDHLQLCFRWPYDWNPGSSYSWNTLGIASASPDIREKHILKTDFHLGNDATVLNNQFSVQKPNARGIHDPLEGYVIGDRGVGISDAHFHLHQESRVSEKVRALCFSIMEATEETVIPSIEKTIIDNDHRWGSNYMYAKYENPILFRIVTGEFNYRIGTAVVTPEYFSEDGIERNGTIRELYCGFGGGIINLLGGHIGVMTGGDMTLKHPEMEEFWTEINRSIPFKYGPAYGEENEIRVFLYAFDGWGGRIKNFDAISIDVDNSQKFWKLGTHRRG